MFIYLELVTPYIIDNGFFVYIDVILINDNDFNIQGMAMIAFQLASIVFIWQVMDSLTVLSLLLSLTMTIWGLVSCLYVISIPPPILTAPATPAMGDDDDSDAVDVEGIISGVAEINRVESESMTDIAMNV